MTTARAFLAAPLLVLAYGVIRILDGLDGVRGPGLAWTAGHLAFAFALVLFVPILLTLRKLAGAGRFATVTAIVGLAGVAALIVQFGIDLVLGFLADDKADMSRMAQSVSSIAGVEPVVYVFGPILFYVALVVLVAQLTVRRVTAIWVPVLVFVNTVAPSIDLDLIPLGAICLLIAFVPLARVVSARETVPQPVLV